MVGGVVIEVAEVVVDGERRVFIDCREHVWSGKERREVPTKQTCAIYVAPDANTPHVAPGDIVWWQGGTAFWTPQGENASDERRAARALMGGDGGASDIRLRKVGGSGVRREDRAEVGGA